MKYLSVTLPVLACLGLLVGCKAAGLDTCQADADCDVGFFCSDGACLCRTNDACGTGQYCNPFGSCQARPPCLGNQDCNADEICNSSDPRTGGSCIPATSCGASVHCPFNNYCSKPSADVAGTCQPGCRSTGDCQLGQVCSGGACVSGGTASDCTTCPASPDPDATYCDYGEICSAQGSCQAAPDKANICKTCSQFSPCPGSDTICLIDEQVHGAEYCAPKCMVDADCPNGYAESGCGKLIIVDPSSECTSTGICSGGRICMQQAESASAYCSCLSDNDCGAGGSATCDNFLGQQACSNTGLPCANDAECEVSCTQVPYGTGTAGVCMTAVGGCGKDQGFTCQNLQTSQADCRLQ